MLCSVSAAWAQEITADEALQRAIEQISKKSYARKVRGKADFALVHTEKGVGNGKALYYVFGKEKADGFLITGADLRANAVLGYTENGTYEEALQIPAFRSWIESCQEAMQWLSHNAAEAKAAKKSPQFDTPDRVATSADKSISLTIPGRQYTPDASLPAKVEPLLGDITWDQDEPYNRLCPDITVDGKKEKCATGCAATAMAQVMKYYEWPKQGTGSHSYTSKGDEPVELEADFSKSVYDWDNMLNNYKEGEHNDVQANAVAKLMSDVGIAVDMNYGPTSYAFGTTPPAALATYFGYNKGFQHCKRAYYNYAEWNNLLKKELAESRPLCFSARDMYIDDGHEFVLDGYDEDGKYHVNWGWGGLSNGYFDINLLDPDLQGTGGSTYNFPGEQDVNIKCFPDKDGTSVAQQFLVVQNEISLEGGSLCYHISNFGLAPFLGKAGFIACVDDKIVGSCFKDVTEKDSLAYDCYDIITAPLEKLGITPEMIGDKYCYIYPAYYDGTTYRVPQSKPAFQSYVLLGVEGGELANLFVPEENAQPQCENIEITRNYTGFDVKAKAVISNNEDCPTFDRSIYMLILDDEEQIVAVGSNFDFIEAGEKTELEFCCKPYNGRVMEEGKTYHTVLEYYKQGMEYTIPGGTTTVSMKNPGAEPQRSYYNFKLDKNVIARNEQLTISFDVDNTGGFGIEKYSFGFFREGEEKRFIRFPMSETDTPTGKTTVSATLKTDFDEGNYHIAVYNDEDGKSQISPDFLYFSINNPETAISSVTSIPHTPTVYYDLQGRRVATPTKGVYIKDGKKRIK